ncbi:MAG: hypothetical protein FWG87_13120 [Defluviitaleaceae bacterium]|nr:hypothetical protein [Defluviitaleaceae bacterium]
MDENTNKTPETSEFSVVKEEILSRVIGSMAIKSIIAGAILYFMYGSDNELIQRPSIFGLAAMFLILYWVLTIFAFAIKLTRNYIIGFVVGIAMLLGIGYVFDKVNIFAFDSLGTDILLFILMATPLFFEIRKVVRLVKMR